jgi:beta-galactosidase/beta-glucuronidase
MIATAARRGTLRSIVLDDGGREVARFDTAFALARGQRLELEQQLHVATPRLWSVAQPYLYALRTEVLDGTKPVDVVTTPFGIRSIAFDKDRGFLLNGRRVKLNGVNLHHDAGGLGAAVPEGVWERRLALLRSMGVNAIARRTIRLHPSSSTCATAWGFSSWRRRSTSGRSAKCPAAITTTSRSGRLGT